MIAFFLLFGVGPLPVPPAKTEPPSLTGPVRDHVKMFSEAARAEAAERINELEKEHGHDLIIETIEEQPSTSEFSGLLYQTNRNAYLRDWAIKRARAAGVKTGVYVVISRSPRDIWVVPFPEELGSKFTSVKLNSIRLRLQQHIASNPDRSLRDGLVAYAYVLDLVRESASPLATVPLLIVIGSMVGAFVALLVLRRRVLSGGEPLYPAAVQGGLFGTPAAGWIYDRLYQPAASAPAAPAPPPTSRVEDDEP